MNDFRCEVALKDFDREGRKGTAKAAKKTIGLTFARRQA
jgi:hypothetical protein